MVYVLYMYFKKKFNSYNNYQAILLKPTLFTVLLNNYVNVAQYLL